MSSIHKSPKFRVFKHVSITLVADFGLEEE